MDPAPLNSLDDPALFLNRELSWLEFNQRVLDQALDPAQPLLERLKFLIIVSTNLDEFFRIRVAGVQRQLGSATLKLGGGRLPPEELLVAINARARELVGDQRACLLQDVLPALERRGIRLLRYDSLSAEQQAWLETQFERQVFPLLTPLAPLQETPPETNPLGRPHGAVPVDPTFPHVHNRTVSLLLLLESESDAEGPPLAVVEIPASLPRLFRLPGEGHDYVLLDQVLRAHVGQLFPGSRVRGCYNFCLSRDADLQFDEDVEDLLGTVEQELRKREWGDPVRLEVADEISPEGLARLRAGLGLREQQIYRLAGPLRLQDLMPLCALEEFPKLRFPRFSPAPPPALGKGADLFAAIRARDRLLWHPYESFEPLVRLLETAAADPRVLAIKQTLYRTSGDSPIIAALGRAARRGKQVTVVIELRARFDEARNIAWSRQLEQAGAQVVFGPPGLKTHCKALLIFRREGDNGALQGYVHLGTGNYHPATARLYTDLGLLTCRPEFIEDVSRLFNLLTGQTSAPAWRRLIVAPDGLRRRLLELIEREAAVSTPERPGRLIARMNSLVDPQVIRALCRASQAGVRIDLLVRGICCLRPGLPGVSAGVRVTSIVGRFLEHARAFYFQNGGEEEVYLSSADWMPRNFDRRVEAMFPLLDADLQRRLLQDILCPSLADNTHAYRLHSDGTWSRRKPPPEGPRRDSQAEFLAQSALEASHEPSPAPAADRLTSAQELLTAQDAAEDDLAG